MFRFLLLCLVLLLPLGCTTPKTWQKPGVEPDQRQQAIEDCRRFAAERMRSHRVYSEELFHGQSMDSGPGSDLSSAQQRVQEADILHMRDKLFAECMHDKGYSQRPVRR